MRNNSQNIRMGRRQIERKRKEMKNRIFHLTLVIVMFMIVFSIRNIYTRLEEMQSVLKQLEPQTYEMIQTDAETKEEEKYIDGINIWEVEKPIERTEAEVLHRLCELGEIDSVIQGIYQNSSRYPDELLAALANNPEMADFAAGYPDHQGNGTGGLTDAEKEQDFPLFLQWDPRWGYQSYGRGSCIGLAGCGPTCLSMALFYLTRDESLTPDKIAKYSIENGYYVDGTGTAWALMEDVPKLYGIHVTSISASAGNIQAVLDNGGIVICSMGRGDFTLSGHYIVIYGYDSAGFMINDPNCVARSSRRWSFDELKYQTKNIWAYTLSGQDFKDAVTTSTITVYQKDVSESR